MPRTATRGNHPRTAAEGLRLRWPHEPRRAGRGGRCQRDGDGRGGVGRNPGACAAAWRAGTIRVRAAPAPAGPARRTIRRHRSPSGRRVGSVRLRWPAGCERRTHPVKTAGRRSGPGKRAVVAHIGPQTAGARLALGQDRHGGIVVTFTHSPVIQPAKGHSSTLPSDNVPQPVDSARPSTSASTTTAAPANRPLFQVAADHQRMPYRPIGRDVFWTQFDHPSEARPKTGDIR